MKGKHPTNVGTVPTYVLCQCIDGGKSKWKNLTKGGFETDAATEEDPARLAEIRLDQMNADPPADSVFSKQRGAVTGDGQFEVFNETSVQSCLKMLVNREIARINLVFSRKIS